jgi:two-component system, cell cycle sensor histidine kinase and response regulator CckA
VKTIATSVLPSVKNGAESSSTAGEPARVLVVDDEESIRTYVDRVLSKAGYRTTLATGGPDAIGVAAADRFDLLLTDVMMPDMTGAELARRLRQINPLLKVLYLTGYTDQLFTEKVTLWEDEAFLEKPCSPEALLQAVSLAVTGRIKAI